MRDKEILAAKDQIQNAPLVRTDDDLYAPLFRNISTFKRCAQNFWFLKIQVNVLRSSALCCKFLRDILMLM